MLVCYLFLDIRDIFTDTVNSVFKFPIKQLSFPALKLIEYYTIKRANTLNLVSMGFADYFTHKINKNCRLSYISNGIDECFYNYLLTLF